MTSQASCISFENDEILIDGGVVNNYPVDELRAKGMDIIIGVDVQDGLASREELTSAPDLLFQINNFRTVHDMTEKVKKTDIYIKPNIEDFSVVSFDDGSNIIKNGKEAAISQGEALKKIVRRQKQRPLLEIKKPVQDSIKINSIITKGKIKIELNKDVDATKLTLEQVKDLIEKKTPVKKTATKKAPAKKK